MSCCAEPGPPSSGWPVSASCPGPGISPPPSSGPISSSALPGSSLAPVSLSSSASPERSSEDSSLTSPASEPVYEPPVCWPPMTIISSSSASSISSTSVVPLEPSSSPARSAPSSFSRTRRSIISLVLSSSESIDCSWLESPPLARAPRTSLMEERKSIAGALPEVMPSLFSRLFLCSSEMV